MVVFDKAVGHVEEIVVGSFTVRSKKLDDLVAKFVELELYFELRVWEVLATRDCWRAMPGGREACRREEREHISRITETRIIEVDDPWTPC